MKELKPRNASLLLSLIIILGLGIRIFWGLHQSNDLSSLPDQHEYLALANNLLSHQGLQFSDARFGQTVYAYRTPGYPLLIALCRASLRAVRIVQALLDVATMIAIWLLARRWLSSTACLLAVALIAFNPYMIYFSGTILTETLFTAMLACGLAMLVLNDGPWPADSGKLLGWLTGAMILVLSILVRPGALILPVILTIAAALLNRHHQPAYRKWWPLPVASTVVLLTIFVLAPWALRNQNRLGAWVWTSTNDGITRYDGFNPDATGASDQRFVQRMPWLASMSEQGRSDYLSEKASEFIRQHPRRAWELAAIKIARTWSPFPLSQEFGSRWYYVAVGLCYGTIFYLLILAGLWNSALPAPAKRYLLLPALYFTAAAALSVGSLRYRIPAEPPMAIIAASVLRPRVAAADRPA